MKKFKYVIVSPRWNTGGAIALHALCKYLSENGEDAKMFYVSRFIYREKKHLYYWIHWMAFCLKDCLLQVLALFVPHDRIKGYVEVSVKGCKRKKLPFISNNTIVVYPDVIYGNPLRAKHVVRWLLYYYGKYYPDADETWGENFKSEDLVFCYRKIFNDKRFNPTERCLCTPYYDLDLYKRTNFGERKGKCFILRKGLGRKDLPSSFDGIVIDDLPEIEKVHVFNECEYCISYDTQTAYSKIAAMCGCISVVVPEKGKRRNDYRTDEDVDCGEAFGFSNEEIEYAISTRDRIRDYYIETNEYSKKSVMNFVEECESSFS